MQIFIDLVIGGAVTNRLHAHRRRSVAATGVVQLDVGDGGEDRGAIGCGLGVIDPSLLARRGSGCESGLPCYEWLHRVTERQYK